VKLAVNDIIGCALDCDEKTISYYYNGTCLGIAFRDIQIFDGLFPAVSIVTNTNMKII
jgi:hypothetical protein